MNDNSLETKDKCLNDNNVSPCGDALVLSSDNTRDKKIEEAINKAVKGAKLFLVSQGQSYYDLGKALNEALQGLTDLEKSQVYTYLVDYIGISTKTLKNIVYLYRKLANYTFWHTHTSLFKMRLFQLAYYIWKRTSDFDLVFRKAYEEIVSNEKIQAWLLEASYKDIINWAKERFETYFKAFGPRSSYIVKCDVCGGDLKQEDKGKSWDFVPVHFACYEMLKENDPNKIKFLKGYSRRVRYNKDIQKELEDIERLKQELVKKIEEYDKLRLAKSRRYKAIVQQINSIVQ
jgi:hypothetical protein